MLGNIVWIESMYTFALILGVFLTTVHHQLPTALASSAANVTNLDELIFWPTQERNASQQKKERLNKKGTKARKRTTSTDRQERQELDETIKNIVNIDRLSKENVNQFKLINECNARLRMLETELNTINSAIQQVSSKDRPKTARYVSSGVTRPMTRASDNNKEKKVRIKAKVVPKLAVQELVPSSASSRFYNSHMMQKIRKEFINYLK